MADELSHRIRRARDEAELTREQMAPRLGITLRTLARYETGETQRISTGMLLRIAAVTGKPVGFFLNGEVEHEDAKSRQRDLTGRDADGS